MAAASDIDSRAPILLRPRNFQWYFNSSANPWSDKEDWMKYSDIVNEIIEDAFNEKKFSVEIDGDYVVNFQYQVQYKKCDRNRQQPIKRLEINNDRSDVRLREERFSSPITLISALSIEEEEEEEEENDNAFCDPRIVQDIPYAYCHFEILGHSKSVSDVVEEAAKGILIEATILNKEKEAQWLSEQLLRVKHFGDNLKAVQFVKIPSEIGKTCVHLYSRDSFLFKQINHVLQNSYNITCEQVKTLGPFCFLLQRYLKLNSSENLIVYRGLTLTDAQRQDYMKGEFTFTAFTSTSKNRDVAEFYNGNTLLIIDLAVKSRWFDGNVHCGVDITSLSQFHQEEEVLIYPSAVFYFVKYEYDSIKKKHIIYLKSSDRNCRV
jgi:hypothetical protein